MNVRKSCSRALEQGTLLGRRRAMHRALSRKTSAAFGIMEKTERQLCEINGLGNEAFLQSCRSQSYLVKFRLQHYKVLHIILLIFRKICLQELHFSLTLEA